MKRALHILKDTFSDSQNGIEQDAIKRLNDAKKQRSIDQHPQVEETTPKITMEKPQIIIGKDTPPDESPLSVPSQLQQKESVVEIQEDNTIKLDMVALKSLVEQKVKEQADRDSGLIRQAEDDAKKAKLEAEEAKDKIVELEKQFQDQLKEERKKTSDWTRIFADTGYDLKSVDHGVSVIPTTPKTTPYFQSDTPRAISGLDAFREVKRMIDSKADCPLSTAVNRQSGEIVEFRDYTHLDRFTRQHRDSIIEGLDQQMKRNGLLQGRNSDNTSPLTIPPMYLETLSALTRVNHSSSFIFWQFANRNISLGYNVGDTIQITRVRYSTSATTTNSWKLDPLVEISATNQALEAGHVKAILEEYGLGKDATMPPLTVAEFYMRTSLLDLMPFIERNLGYNYNQFEDLLIRELWSGTSRIVYNDNGGVTTTVGNVNTGDSGILNLTFLTNLYAYLFGTLQVPPLDDGHYILVTNPFSAAGLTNSLQENSRYTTRMAMEELTSLLKQTTRNDIGKTDGYLYSVANFHVFVTNAFGSGIAGTEGVQNETTGAGSKLTRSSYVAGRDTVGRSIAMPFTIKRAKEDGFGRINRYIWNSYECAAALDVDPASNPPLSNDQQLRVVEVRTLDVAL
jgi:hypothetical protein